MLLVRERKAGSVCCVAGVRDGIQNTGHVTERFGYLYVGALKGDTRIWRVWMVDPLETRGKKRKEKFSETDILAKPAHVVSLPVLPQSRKERMSKPKRVAYSFHFRQ